LKAVPRTYLYDRDRSVLYVAEHAASPVSGSVDGWIQRVSPVGALQASNPGVGRHGETSTLLMQDFLRTELADWQQDLSPAWRAFFDGVQLDFDHLPVGHEMKARPLIPPRRDPSRPRTAPSVFKAFADMEPDAVRVLVIGQDPYPQAGRATGRSFEDGLFVAWDGRVANSVKAIRRAAIAARLDRPELLVAADVPWKRLVRIMADAPQRCDEPLGSWFDAMAGQGVLFVNAALTLTHYRYGGSAEQAAHMLLWRPLVRRLVLGLADPTRGPTIFLLLGHFARKLFHDLMDGEPASQSRTHAATSSVEHWHPSYYRFLEANPLLEVNSRLSELGGRTIIW
jgi:uracil-DNA glycosylase